MPGAAGTETFSFSVIGTGSTEVRFTYSQPWTGGTKAARTVSLGIRTFAAPGGPVAVTCDQFAAAADSSGRSFVARPLAPGSGRDRRHALLQRLDWLHLGDARLRSCRPRARARRLHASRHGPGRCGGHADVGIPSQDRWVTPRAVRVQPAVGWRREGALEARPDDDRPRLGLVPNQVVDGLRAPILGCWCRSHSRRRSLDGPS